MWLQQTNARWRHSTEGNLTRSKQLLYSYHYFHCCLCRDGKEMTGHFLSYQCFASVCEAGFCCCVLPRSLSISVMPLSRHRVLFEQGGDPLLALGLPFTSRFSLSFLQDELLIGGLGLVLVVDGPGHVLPQPGGETVRDFMSETCRTRNR